MVLEIKPPDARLPNGNALFLAGTIDSGNSVNWQGKVVRALTKSIPDSARVIIYNPRRAPWPTDANEKTLHEQINWELDRLTAEVNNILFYFAPGSKSPISLLELGLVINDPEIKKWVVCPEGYWRRDNVLVTSERGTNVKIFDTLAKAMPSLIKELSRCGYSQYHMSDFGS